ncbi:hypothetical protein THIOSC15_1780009 [uncultured Thiomicrorhabdus sp.]
MRSVTGRSKRAEYLTQQRLLDNLEMRYQGRVRFEIAKTMRAVAKSYGEVMIIDKVMFEHKERMTRLLKALWSDSADAMITHISGQKSARLHLEKKDIVPKTELITSFMQYWIATFGAEKITRITETTRHDIEFAIKKGLEDGKSENDIADYIMALAPSIAAGRAATIARTETSAAASSAAMETARAMELPMTKTWVSADNERTRKAHKAADGQTVSMNEPFIVDGQRLMQPSDPSGRPENVINCRCVAIFNVID